MTQLAKLADLAKDTSIPGRTSFLKALTDLYLSAGEARGERVSFLYGDIALRVLDQVEGDSQASLAERVCHDDLVPLELLRHLAKQDLETAAPVLQYSPVLQSDDLAAIAATASMGHLGIIAGRSNLAQDVTTVLVDRGDQDVLSKVAANLTASFADASFVKLVEKAGADAHIQALLLERPDLSDEAGLKLLPLLSPELQKQISVLGEDHKLSRLMVQAREKAAAAKAKKLEQARAEVNALVKSVVDGETPVDQVVSRFANGNQAPELGFLLAKMCNLPVPAVSQLLFSPNDKPLIILCKAQNISADAYKDILMMRAQRLPIGGLALNEAIQRYDSMGLEGARRSLEALRQTCQPPPSPEEQEAAANRKSIPFASSR